MTTMALGHLRAASKRAIRLAPLSMRKRAAVALQRQAWLPPHRRRWWAVELVRDLADRNLDAFHEFLWTNHLGYAATYEVAERFGPENVRASRRMFFEDLARQLQAAGAAPATDVKSVFEVGCSLGYQLRQMELDLFPAATTLEGIDLDRHAIASGAEYLRGCGSKVAVRCGDAGNLAQELGDRRYDVIVCTGVLMYLTEVRAADAVRAMLRQANALVALAGLAHPQIDNADLARSDMRPSDRTFIHNLDRMVRQAGGTIHARRWEGARDVDGNTIYFVFASAA
jgi:2-polyprenyl-3-methyl-5-hydroxy-6-metoxy-1,4-benzoquinol methylase